MRLVSLTTSDIPTLYTNRGGIHRLALGLGMAGCLRQRMLPLRNTHAEPDTVEPTRICCREMARYALYCCYCSCNHVHQHAHGESSPQFGRIDSYSPRIRFFCDNDTIVGDGGTNTDERRFYSIHKYSWMAYFRVGLPCRSNKPHLLISW